ncbi:hypothetical protein STEG23_030904 [Scotinomys teguina]
MNTKKKGDSVLENLDLGLPPNPNTSHCGLKAATPAIPNPPSLIYWLATSCSPRLCPLSFGKGVEFDPLPPKEIKYTSSVKYNSDVQMPVGLVVASCCQSPVSPVALGKTVRLRCTSSPATSEPPSSTPSTPKPSTPPLESTEFLGSDRLSDEC